MFYGSANLDTVLAELTPQIGDYVHVGVAQLIPGRQVSLTTVGELDHLRRTGRLLLSTDASLLTPHLDNTRNLLVDAFFADAFLQPSSRPRDGHRLTAALSEVLLEKSDAFAYPSVAHRGGLNFAVRPDRFDALFEWREFISYKIVGYLGFGLYADCAMREQPLGNV